MNNIETIKDYFIEMKLKDNVFFIRLKLKPKWQAFPLIEEGVEIIRTVNDGDDILLFMEDTNRTDLIIKHAKTIIDFNLKAEEKLMILDEKITELKQIFEKEDVKKLKKLKFSFSK